MKRLFVVMTLFVAFCSVSLAQSTPKATKTSTKSSVAKKKSHKAMQPKVASVTTPAAEAKPAVPTGNGPIATFEKTEIDYGKAAQGSEPLRVFTFKNTGTEPLIISNAQGSCGCTVPTYPKEPIMPGQSSKIEVRYDTQRVGGFTKSVTLTTNEASSTRVLTIKGEILAAPTEGAKN
jgi:hypothetical protein